MGGARAPPRPPWVRYWSGGRAPSRRWLWGSGGKAPSRWAIFVSFWKKKLFKSRWITFRTSSEPFQRTRFLTFQSQSKKFSCSILFLQLNPKTRLESCIMV